MADPTKFDQLCAAYATTRTNFFDYRDSCIALLARVAEQLGKEWEIPNLRLVPLEGKIDRGMKYFPHGATHYDFDNGFFHMGVAFTVYIAPNTYPQDPIIVRLSARKEGGRFMLAVASRAARDVGNGDPESVRPVLDEMFAILDAEYVRTPEKLKQAQAGEPERRVIGFVHEKGAEK